MHLRESALLSQAAVCKSRGLSFLWINNGETVAAVQNAATQNVITFFFLGLEIIGSAVMIAALWFLNVEKVIDKEQAEIKARHEERKA